MGRHAVSHCRHASLKHIPTALLQLNFTAFADVMNVAFGTSFPENFDPFADDYSFLIAAYVLEDVGASAYIVSLQLRSTPHQWYKT